MRHFNREELKQARMTDLYDFLMKHHRSEFRMDGNSLHPVHNGSLSIKKGYHGFKDFATDEKGNSVDFLTK